MAKFISRNELNRYQTVFVIPYGSSLANYLENYGEKIGYNTGIYGWNYDAYEVGRYAVVFGYRSMPNYWTRMTLESASRVLSKAREYFNSCVVECEIGGIELALEDYEFVCRH